MTTWQTTLSPSTSNLYTEEYFTPSSVFFDIETTGFSAARNQVYLIGAAVRTGSKICITQFFAECPSQEQEIISAFLELLSQYDTLISFNGTGFDVPFLKGRCAHHKMPEHLDSFRHLDIYKQLSKYKSILNLPNLKQKTLEKFLGVSREDSYSGGDLISIYLAYAKQASFEACIPSMPYHSNHKDDEKSLISPEEACALLKLHNYEDMEGMIKLLPLLSYPRFFEGHFQVSSWETHGFTTYEGTEGRELILSLELDLPLPKPFTCTLGTLYVSGSCNQHTTGSEDAGKLAKSSSSGSYSHVKMRIELFTGELKYFYPDYKDYYYLPIEDTALHKSVAAYVDKDYRVQATAATCYCKKSGQFLPQYQELFSPALKQEYQSKISWFELAENFTGKKENLKKYAMHLLEQL